MTWRLFLYVDLEKNSIIWYIINDLLLKKSIMALKQDLQTETKTKIKTSQVVATLLVVILGVGAMYGMYIFGTTTVEKTAQPEESSSLASEADPVGREKANCWEADQGDYYVKGFNKNPDEWLDFTLGYDYCVTYSVKTLVEYTCSGSESYDCPYGCFNGRCTEENETCPAGRYCYNLHSRALLDEDCTWSNFETKDEPWLCQDGEFIENEEQPTYWDLDGGNYDVYGFVYNVPENYPTHRDYCVTYGISGRGLVEYLAGGGRGRYDCPYGCFNGRCTEEDETCPAGWYCYNLRSRALLDEDCTWSNFDRIDEPAYCLAGEVINTCGNGDCEWYESIFSCKEDCASVEPVDWSNARPMEK